jgi:hypothetical protein
MRSDPVCGDSEKSPVSGAAGAAADLAQDHRDSTWIDLVTEHASDIPLWAVAHTRTNEDRAAPPTSRT